MMTIYLNDEPCCIESSHSLQDVLIQKNPAQGHFAVAVNNQFVPRVAYDTTALNAGDRVDIIVPMQGG
jgi:sulfur carrier protein